MLVAEVPASDDVARAEDQDALRAYLKGGLACDARANQQLLNWMKIHPSAKVVTTIRPDTVFIPYHWAGKKSANLLTLRAYDPTSAMPEFKKACVRIRRAEHGEILQTTTELVPNPDVQGKSAERSKI